MPLIAVPLWDMELGSIGGALFSFGGIHHRFEVRRHAYSGFVLITYLHVSKFLI